MENNTEPRITSPTKTLKQFKAAALLGVGATWEEAAAQIGVSRATIARWLRQSHFKDEVERRRTAYLESLPQPSELKLDNVLAFRDATATSHFVGKISGEKLGQPWVYFILDTEREAVKIGVAFNPRSRLADLQIGNPGLLRLICCVPGDQVVEQLFHQKFQRYHIRGEWFSCKGGLKATIEILSIQSETLSE